MSGEWVGEGWPAGWGGAQIHSLWEEYSHLDQCLLSCRVMTPVKFAYDFCFSPIPVTLLSCMPADRGTHSEVL